MLLFHFRGNFIKYENDKLEVKPREWKNNLLNFDDVSQAMLTLFTVATFEGWPQ